MIVRDKVTENLNIMAFQCTKVARLIPDNSIIYPVNLTQNWSMLHFDKYLGLCQPMLILDNSECNSNYFPLQWNWDKIPELYLDENNHRADSCFFYSNSEKQERRKIDYIFIMGKNYSNDLCKKNLLWFTHNRCDVVLNDGYFSLYKIK